MLAVFLLLIPTLWGDETEANVLVADKTMSKMIEFYPEAPFCTLYTDRGVIQKMILGADPKKARQISANLVADLEEACKASQEKGKDQPLDSGLIYPGTKWCGPGNLSKSYDDLGHHADEDACCREHDHCPLTILPNECINGICNKSPFTRSYCDCDAKFRRCLQNVNSEVANTLGALFFNVIQVTCFKERRPCSQWQSCPHMWVNSTRYEYPNSPRDYYTHKVLLFKTILQVIRDVLKKKQLVSSLLHMTID
ncbi:phospholipase A2 isoform X2 [Bombus fervidus]